MHSIKKFFSKKKSHLKKILASKKKILVVMLSLFVLFGGLGSFFLQGRDDASSSVPSSSELGIAAFSPLGEGGGLVVPASCPSDLHDAPAGYGNACSASSACATNNGSINCGGACSVGPPALPAGYGSACSVTNACGQAYPTTTTCFTIWIWTWCFTGSLSNGTQQCNGSCSGSKPPMPTGSSLYSCNGATCTPNPPSSVAVGGACTKRSLDNNCAMHADTVGSIQCNVGSLGSYCNAATPVMPVDRWWKGVSCLSAPNLCGMQNADGNYICNGTCLGATIPADSLCNSYNTNKPAVTLTANPKVLQGSGSTTLNWTISGAEQCWHSSSDTSIWSDSPITPANGSTTVTVTAPTTSFSIFCSNAQGSIRRMAYVQIQNDCSPLDCGGPVKAGQVCAGTQYNDVKGCGVNNCSGTRFCDFNWKEVGP